MTNNYEDNSTEMIRQEKAGEEKENGGYFSAEYGQPPDSGEARSEAPRVYEPVRENPDVQRAELRQQLDKHAAASVAAIQSGVIVQLATVNSRFWAFIIDLIVIGMLNAIIFNIFSVFAAPGGWFNQVFTVNFIFLGLTGCAYFVLMTGFYSQTLGKMIMGITVIQSDGQPITWGTALFRELLGRTISQFFGTFLGYIISIFNRRHLALHDLLADTYVVKEEYSLERGFVRVPERM